MERLGVDEFMSRNGDEMFRCEESTDDFSTKDWQKRALKDEKSKLSMYRHKYTNHAVLSRLARLETL